MKVHQHGSDGSGRTSGVVGHHGRFSSKLKDDDKQDYSRMATERVSAVIGGGEDDSALGRYDDDEDDEDDLEAFSDGELGCEDGGRRGRSHSVQSSMGSSRICVSVQGPGAAGLELLRLRCADVFTVCGTARNCMCVILKS